MPEDELKLLQIDMNDDSVIKINNETIEKVDRIEYLGLFVDKLLKLKEHIDYRCMKKNWLPKTDYK